MEWIKCSDQEPPSGEGLLVVKQYLDAPFIDGGYDDSKSFWTEPVIQLDKHWNGSWDQGGKVTHWMSIPKLPKEFEGRKDSDISLREIRSFISDWVDDTFSEE